MIDKAGGPKTGTPVKAARSAKTGHFVTKSTAKRHPGTTVVEKVRHQTRPPLPLAPDRRWDIEAVSSLAQ